MEGSVETVHKCPFIMIDTVEGLVCCSASNFGKGLSGKQKFEPLSRDVIVNCSSADHVYCPTYKRRKWTDRTRKYGVVL